MKDLLQKAFEAGTNYQHNRTTPYKTEVPDFETWYKQLHKHDVSSCLSIEELIWQKQNPDEPFNADDFYDWAAENSKQALDFAFDIYRELGR